MARYLFPIAFVLLWHTSAVAEQVETRRSRLVVLEVLFEGDLPRPMQQRVTERLMASLASDTVEVIGPDVVAQALAPLGPSIASTCRAGQCVRWILDVLDADGGLSASVTAVESSYTLHLTVFGPDGDELGATTSQCDICTFEELEESAAAAVGQVPVEVPRRLRPGRIGVSPEPVGASVVVDGVAVGQGAVSVPVAPGLHSVEVSLDGHLPQSLQVEVSPAVTAQLQVLLLPGEVPPPVVPHVPNPRPWLWSVFGTGIALALSGSVLLAIAEPNERDSQWPMDRIGMGMVAGGAGVALVSAITLAIIGRLQEAQPSEQ